MIITILNIFWLDISIIQMLPIFFCPSVRVIVWTCSLDIVRWSWVVSLCVLSPGCCELSTSLSSALSLLLIISVSWPHYILQRSFQYHWYFIFRSHHIGWLSIWQCWPVSGGLRTIHWPTLSAPGPAGEEKGSHHGEDDCLRRRLHRDILHHSDWWRLGENNYTAREQVIWPII